MPAAAGRAGGGWCAASPPLRRLAPSAARCAPRAEPRRSAHPPARPRPTRPSIARPSQRASASAAPAPPPLTHPTPPSPPRARAVAPPHTAANTNSRATACVLMAAPIAAAGRGDRIERQPRRTGSSRARARGRGRAPGLSSVIPIPVVAFFSRGAPAGGRGRAPNGRGREGRKKKNKKKTGRHRSACARRRAFRSEPSFPTCFFLVRRIRFKP